MGVKQLTRNTKTSTAAVAKRAEALVIQYLPDIVARVVEVDKASSLMMVVRVKPAGRTDATKDPDVTIKAKPDYGEEVVTFKARLTGEGDDAQLTLISEMVTDLPDPMDAEPEFDDAGKATATG